MPYCDIMKPLHRSTPRSPGNYCEFNPNQVSSPKGEGSPKTTKLGNRTTQGCYRIPLFAPACRPAGSYRTVILATLTQVFPVQVTTNKSISKNVSFRFSEPRDPSSQECCPNSANPGEQTGAGALFSFGGVVEEFLENQATWLQSCTPSAVPSFFFPTPWLHYPEGIRLPATLSMAFCFAPLR